MQEIVCLVLFKMHQDTAVLNVFDGRMVLGGRMLLKGTSRYVEARYFALLESLNFSKIYEIPKVPMACQRIPLHSTRKKNKQQHCYSGCGFPYYFASVLLRIHIESGLIFLFFPSPPLHRIRTIPVPLFTGIAIRVFLYIPSIRFISATPYTNLSPIFFL
ncbi:hypothetical protein VNO77_12722 [Canavalia gladiata]|uniref:Uncharacterized protein n=1 Tax=Canavalia gladiata TaxID=3824 RepID=A0AAN9QMY9_CANGL